jgi:rubrerythrin
MHIQFIFRPLEDLEGSLMALYQWYADVFTLDAEARAMFTKLAGEEKNHVALVRYQKKLVTKNISLFGNVDVDLQDVRHLTAAAQRLTKATPRPSLEEAVTTALKFERSAGESHLRTAMRQANPDMDKLLTALCQGDKGHVSGLEAFAKKRGISTAGQPS